MIIGLIPARSGSKRIPDKNIKLLGGYPLMAWSIICARMCGLPTYVSSDSQEYLRLAVQYGAIPHLRLSGYEDYAKDVSVISDFIQHVDYQDIVFLRPTTPLRNPTLINLIMQAYEHYRAHYITICKMRDGDFYRNTGYCEIFPTDAFGKDKVGFVQEQEVGEIDEPEDFDYIEWRLQKYGSPIYEYLRNTYPI